MLLSHLLKNTIRVGSLTVIDAAGKTHVFSGSPGPEVTVRLHDRALHRRLFFYPELYIGEAYMDGTLTIERGTLDDFMNIATMNLKSIQNNRPNFILEGFLRLLRGWQQHNPVKRARANVAHHYDLQDRLYDLFLDRDRQYSCAYFQNPDDDLETAQASKQRHLAAKLLLAPGQRVLDIGSGWGGLALYLARIGEGRVTGLTLSREQRKVAIDRAAKTDLADKVRFHLRDYREESGTYDRIVSVGMFEHVGVNYYPEFFAKVKDLL
ncbi:MAG TPA: class I SAM-dependent methyltransferase, partial [Rhodospirillales bacterium]|nr:class I SAM-dependent methyltransferase [Rhodospirillales bacterium]